MGSAEHGDMTPVQPSPGSDMSTARDLLPLVYAELRQMAKVYLAHSPAGITLQPTALVHEAFVRLVGAADSGWNGRGHFFGAAAMAMRQIMVDHARSKAALKRGGGRKRVDLHNLAGPLQAEPHSLLALDEALERLEAEEPRKGRVVMLRFFAGLTNQQTAQVMNLPLRTVERDWSYAKAWLRAELAHGSE